MARVESKLDQPLREFLRDEYAKGTLDEVAAAIKARTGITVDSSTVLKWMDRLGLERRFPGQRPEAVA